MQIGKGRKIKKSAYKIILFINAWLVSYETGHNTENERAQIKKWYKLVRDVK